MSSSSSAALVPRISGVDAAISVTNVTEVPLIDASRAILAALDRFRYYTVLRNFGEVLVKGGVAGAIKQMPVNRATHWNIMIDDLNEEAVAHKYLHFVSTDGSVGPRISIYGADFQQAIDTAANSFIPMIKMVRKAVGNILVKESAVGQSISSSILFKGTVSGNDVVIPIGVRAPEAFANAIAVIFGFNNDVIAEKNGYLSYEHDLPYFR